MKSLFEASPEQEDVACLRVGRFIQRWSYLEAAMNHGIGEFLNCERLLEVIVLANVQARDKINALKTLLHTYAPSDEARTAAASIMNQIGNMNGDRNLVAHNMFWAYDAKGAVEFSTTKAKGKFALPKVVWTPKDFDQRVSLMGVLMVDLKRAVKLAASYQRLHAKPKPTLNALAEFATNSGLGLLGDLYRQDLQPPENPSSPPASPKKAARKAKTPSAGPKGG
jgi:hypothetical protein